MYVCTCVFLQCQPPFVGDGLSCTLDSDSDGYPDQALDSPSCTADPSLTYCTAVRLSFCTQHTYMYVYIRNRIHKQSNTVQICSCLTITVHTLHLLQDVCPEVSNPEQDPVECEPDATVMER